MKHSAKHFLRWLLPAVIALPAVIGMFLVWNRYGQTGTSLIISGVKLVVRP